MPWQQKTISVRKSRGCHLITPMVLSALPDLSLFKVGLLHVFLQHTSAGLTLNENADPDVRKDMETVLNRLVPENADYVHTDEGSDDMPGHVKCSLMGAELNIPVKDGRLLLGTWQGIWFCEHRNHGGERRIVLTLQGETK